jgi:hypothetical protein
LLWLLDSPVAVSSPAVYGLLGSLIGGSIAGSVSLLVAWQSRGAAERAWVRDNRRGIYAEFLTNAQEFLIALLKGERVEEAYDGFFKPWGVVQTVAGPKALDAARTYGYRLLELKNEYDANNPSGPEYFDEVAGWVRRARHATIAAMRSDLGLAAAPLCDHYEGFVGTGFEDEFRAARERRKRLAKSSGSGSAESLTASGDVGEEPRPVA